MQQEVVLAMLAKEPSHSPTRWLSSTRSAVSCSGACGIPSAPRWPGGSDAALLLEGIVLRLQADLRWLEACERNWTGRKDRL